MLRLQVLTPIVRVTGSVVTAWINLTNAAPAGNPFKSEFCIVRDDRES